MGDSWVIPSVTSLTGRSVCSSLRNYETHCTNPQCNFEPNSLEWQSAQIIQFEPDMQE